ncbi:hypothetical protein KJ742_03635 [Patescibacteria group bacterium]|nr:hypothetical protein [Patescibacteria group bacterium]
MKKKHRDSQHRFYVEDGTYFVTSNTFNWHPYFKERIFCDLFVENLRLCKRLKGFYLYAWFLGYNHSYLLVRPGEEFGLSKVMQFLKRHISRNINIIMGYKTEPNITPEGAIGQSRLRGGGYECFRQIIDEHDQKLKLLKFRFKTEYLNRNPYPKFKWEKSYHDHYIRNDDDFDNHWEYIKRNPEKHGLPDDWPYMFLNDEYEDLIDNPL